MLLQVSFCIGSSRKIKKDYHALDVGFWRLPKPAGFVSYLLEAIPVTHDRWARDDQTCTKRSQHAPRREQDGEGREWRELRTSGISCDEPSCSRRDIVVTEVLETEGNDRNLGTRLRSATVPLFSSRQAYNQTVAREID